jgi:4-amino-4-deoxy-L-arabinose transferase-like glycosyltransferase
VASQPFVTDKTVRAAVASLTLLFGAFCVMGLGDKALWNDEAFSFFVAWRDVAHTLAMMRQDTQPPLYYLVLTFWLRLGHAPAMLRGLSVLAMTACVPLVFDAAQKLLGMRVALLAVLLFVVAPQNVEWAQAARPYAVQAFCVAVGFWGFTRIWVAAPRAWVGWAAYVIGGGLSVLAQYPAVFFLLGCNGAMAVRVARAWPAERRLAKAWVLAQLALILVWLPWAADGAEQVFSHLTPAEIAAKHTLFLVDGTDLLGRLTGILAIPYLWRVQPAFTALSALVGVLGVVALVRRGRAGWPVLACAVVPVAVCVLAWALVHPVFGYVIYTFVWLRVPYAMLLAAGLIFVRPRLLGVALGALLLAGNVWGLKNHWQAANPPLDRVAALIAPDVAGDGLLLSTTQATRWALAYYVGPPYAGRIDGLDVGDIPAAGWPILTPMQALRDKRLWVVLPDGEELPFSPAALAPAMQRTMQQRIGTVLVERYDRVP